MSHTVPPAPVRPRIEELEDRCVPAVTIRFDYSYDRSGFFADPARRAALDRAAAGIGPNLGDSLAAITPSGNNTWKASFEEPATNQTIVLTNPNIGQNEVVIYVAGAGLGATGELGLTTTGGFTASGTKPWLETVRGRGQSGALAANKTDFSTWGGMITFEAGVNWHFGADLPKGGTYDFQSVATHELMHVFGFGLGEPAFVRNVIAGQLAGPTVTAVAGGPVAVVGDPPDHFAPGTRIDGAESPMMPALPMGTRRSMTRLEYAALADIGWNLVGGPIASVNSTGVSSPILAAIPGTQTDGRFVVGGAGTITVYGAGGNILSTDSPFPGYTGPIRVARADVTGDGVADTIATTGPGRAVTVVVYDGKTGASLVSFSPFEAGFTGGAFLAAADLNGDGKAEIVVSPDESGGPVVAVYDGAGAARGQVVQLARFFGVNDPNFRGGARVALGDVNGDGIPDLTIAAGTGGGPRVAVYDGTTVRGGRTPVTLVPDFFAFETDLRNGVFVTVADLNRDGLAEIVVGAGPGGAPRVAAFSGKDLLANRRSTVANFFSGDTTQRGGVRVASADVDSDGRPDIITGTGTGNSASVFTGVTIATSSIPSAMLTVTTPLPSADGVYVG